MIIPKIVGQHAADAAFLSHQRTRAVLRADHRLRHLVDLDERLEAHLDGLRAAGDESRTSCNEILGRSERGSCFAPALLAIERAAGAELDEFLALSEADEFVANDVRSAFGWTEPRFLRHRVVSLLQSGEPFRCTIGLEACARHRVDPGRRLLQLVQDEHDGLSVRALEAVAELGRSDLVPICLRVLEDSQNERRLAAARAAVLLGNRGAALEVLESLGRVSGPLSWPALDLTLRVVDPPHAHALLMRLNQNPDTARPLLRGSGVAGNPEYIPWLIRQMSKQSAARLAGEALSVIAGLDLSALRLDRPQPDKFEAGPNDDPEDADVEMDEDDGLPWPDPVKIRAWWEANSQRFQAGVRYFMGEPLNRQNCLRVLQQGYQRQRSAAALYLSLLNPGTPLFEWRAPAWRQQRLLAEMS